jgi:hypothetical protein
MWRTTGEEWLWGAWVIIGMFTKIRFLRILLNFKGFSVNAETGSHFRR